MNLVSLSDLTAEDVGAIIARVPRDNGALSGTVGWSFEGNGIRTRTTFIQAFRELGLRFTELPNLLKTTERPKDLAGYLDSSYRLYVIRESNHARLSEFAAASSRPVINAMSTSEHPCEVLTDAYFIDRSIRPLAQARICLWGPTTNIHRSWHELARTLGIRVTQVCKSEFHEVHPNVEFTEMSPDEVDVVITDSWPSGVENYDLPLTINHLHEMGSPSLLPTPPFTVGRELAFDPTEYPKFVGYDQKSLLLPVQKAIIRHVAEA